MRIARHRLGRRTAPVTASLAIAVVVAVALSGCASGRADGATGDGRLSVVASTNVWGDLARQLGGEHVDVTSIVDGPDADPHDYEPTASDARGIATADLVVVNGLGYDAWAARLAAANPSPRRSVVTVADLRRAGDNPHLWYDPDAVQAMAAAVTAELRRLDPAHAADYETNATAFRDRALAKYMQVIDDLRARYAGTRIGASESIVAPLAEHLGLELVTPARLLSAVSEGVDPTAADKRTATEQIASGAIAVYVLNEQNQTPDVATQLDAARAAGIPIVNVTETMPRGVTFQQWQTTQLEALRAALVQSDDR